MEWTSEAEAKLKEIPFFVRPAARKKIEKFAQELGVTQSTPEIYDRDPDEESVVIYRGTTPDRLLKKTDFLDGEEVVDGFRLAIAELFTELDFD